MHALIEALELTPAQRRHLERIHEILESGGAPGDMAELHRSLVGQLAADELDGAAIRRVVDEHVERMRRTIDAVTDEIVALVDGLDERQREMLREHLRDHAAAQAAVVRPDGSLPD
jgi:hypothetical protein